MIIIRRTRWYTLKGCLRIRITNVRRLADRSSVHVHFVRVPERNAWPDKCPLVILFGLFDNARNWLRFARQFSDKLNRQVVISELRNHGASPHRSTMTFDEMTSDLTRVIDHVTSDLPRPACFLLGHSLGGKVCAHLALNKPDLVKKLIVEDISPVTYEFDPNPVKNLVGPVLAMKTASWTSTSLNEARNEVFEHFKMLGIKDSATRQFLATNLIEKNDGKIDWCLNLNDLETLVPYLYTFPVENASKRYEGPTLFLMGEKSRHFFEKERDTPIIKGYFPNVKFEFMKDCGHYMHLQKPKEFVQIVSNFFGS